MWCINEDSKPKWCLQTKRSSTCDPAVTESRDYPRFQGLCKCSCHQDVRRAIKPQQKLRIQAAIFKLLTMQIASLVWNLDIQKEIESAQILWGIDSWMSNCISSFDSQQLERWKQLPLSISLHQPVQNQYATDDPRIAKHIRNSLVLQSNKLEQSQKQSEAFGISPYFSINIYIYISYINIIYIYHYISWLASSLAHVVAVSSSRPRRADMWWVFPAPGAETSGLSGILVLNRIDNIWAGIGTAISTMNTGIYIYMYNIDR